MKDPKKNTHTTPNNNMPDFSSVSGGASTTATAPGGARIQVEIFEIYTVVAGDTLSKIARRKYGDAKLWKLIHEANRDLIKNPDLIQIDWQLKLPARPE